MTIGMRKLRRASRMLREAVRELEQEAAAMGSQVKRYEAAEAERLRNKLLDEEAGSCR